MGRYISTIIVLVWIEYPFINQYQLAFPSSPSSSSFICHMFIHYRGPWDEALRFRSWNSAVGQLIVLYQLTCCQFVLLFSSSWHLFWLLIPINSRDYPFQYCITFMVHYLTQSFNGNSDTRFIFELSPLGLPVLNLIDNLTPAVKYLRTGTKQNQWSI